MRAETRTRSNDRSAVQFHLAFGKSLRLMPASDANEFEAIYEMTELGSGLLTVFSCWKNESLKRKDCGVETKFDYFLRMQTHLTSFARSTPLDIVVWSLTELGLQKEAVLFLERYEKFLALLDDQDLRKHLAEISEHSVYTDSRFLECREVSHSIQVSLMDVCFDRQTELRDFVREYGVF